MSKPKPEKHPRKLRTGAIVALVLVLILALCLGGGFWWFNDSQKPVSSSQEKIGVEIAEGESSEQLISDLKEKGLIRSENAARLYLMTHKDLTRYAGIFELTPSMSMAEIFDYISTPENAQMTYAVVTLPEGTWAKDEAKIISEAIPGVSEQELLDLWNDSSYIETLARDYGFIHPESLNNDQYFVKLEGYLYPETYYIDYDMTPDQITRMLLDQFNAFYAENIQAFQESGRSVQEIVTLASIVQFESGNPADMPDIAGVMVNRLEQGMPLQSSVTVCYALYDEFNSGEDCETNTDIDSPYNTYQHEGLPIGPILNPGKDALLAALHPADNDYLFFVADIYGDGAVHFATTYEEHQENVEKYNLLISDSE